MMDADARSGRDRDDVRPLPLVLALVALAAAWIGPLPRQVGASFTAHMTMHMAVVAVAAPLLALAVAGGRRDPARRWPALMAPLPAALAELVVVWGWHAPAPHRAARSGGWPLALEQASFLVVGAWLFVAAFGGRRDDRGRTAAGVVALLVTSMHMTLLGALLGLGWRPLYDAAHGDVTHGDVAHGDVAHGIASVVSDQQLGGAVMLLVGGAVYLAGGLGLTARLLRDVPAAGRTAGRTA